MSYDVHFYIDCGGPDPHRLDYDFNYTWNCGPMFRRALAPLDGINGLQGLTGEEAIPHLERAIADMSAPESRQAYQAMNPENGWGDHDSATRWLERILEACREVPKARIGVN